MTRVKHSARKTTDYILVACSDTPPIDDIGFKELNHAHLKLGWFSCGFHKIVRRNGEVEDGRDEEIGGGFVESELSAVTNANSISICMIGGLDEDGDTDANFTFQQYMSLMMLIQDLRVKYPDAIVISHREISQHTDSPYFDVHELMNVSMERE